MHSIRMYVQLGTHRAVRPAETIFIREVIVLFCLGYTSSFLQAVQSANPEK